MKKLLILLQIILFSLYCKAETISIITTGRTLGLSEQCGCTVSIEGGFEARAGFLEKLRKESPNFLLTDIGGFFPEAVEKIDSAAGKTAALAMGKLGYQVVSLSPVDLAHGYTVLQDSLKEANLEAISTNLKSDKTPFWKSSVIKEIGNSKVGFVSIVSILPDEKIPKDFTWINPNEALDPVIVDLRKKQNADLIVLMVYENPIEVASWLQTYKGAKIDAAISLDFGRQMQKIGDTYLVNAGGKGRSVGFAKFEVEKGKGIQDATFENIRIKPEIYNNRPMRSFLDQRYEAVIQELGITLKHAPVLQSLPEEKDPQNAYNGADACKNCHEKEYAQWKETKHAVTFNRVLNSNRSWLPECYVCHATGYGNPAGFQSFPKSVSLAHVQCEACHGPGDKHGKSNYSSFIRKKVPKELCKDCHDAKNSPKFDELFDLFYGKIKHKK